MGSNASKEPGPTCCFGGTKERELWGGVPVAHWSAEAIAAVARMDLLMGRSGVGQDKLAHEGPVLGIFLLRTCDEAEPHDQGLRLIQHSDPLYPQKWGSETYFCEGEFLSNFKVREALGKCLPCGEGAAGSTEQRYPNMVEACLGLTAARFPVIWLKHVTTLDNFRSIVTEGAFRGYDRTFILNGTSEQLGLSCWSVHIPHRQVEGFKSTRFGEFMWRYMGQLSQEERGDVRDMLANSPALRPDSRYGNFQFTFRFEELLRSYKDQHCGGQEPVLRVLGTEAYPAMEVVHWVLIHSPYLGCFHHLPTVDSVWPRSRRGNLLWAPESTTALYTWCTDPSTGHLWKYPLNSSSGKRYDPWMWNNVVFAFYLPGGRTLYLGRGRVEACEKATSLWGDSSRVLRHPPHKYIPKEQADSIIRGERGNPPFAGH